ncbi:MAG: aminotransferase class III-fold pyridoxal phosphate-dependent enzyme, partial [Candidatus Korarchaeota archaeon]|nr:aminotransferase class III-fold pyridoxal phosphate-dependent enzyme [Candidatus Korarchaeota archaeon]
DDVPSRAAKMGKELIKGLKGIESRLIRDVRGEGLMIGVELRADVGPVLRRLQQRGILALKAGRTVLRLLPPYLITEEDVGRIVEEVESALINGIGSR